MWRFASTTVESDSTMKKENQHAKESQNPPHNIPTLKPNEKNIETGEVSNPEYQGTTQDRLNREAEEEMKKRRAS